MGNILSYYQYKNHKTLQTGPLKSHESPAGATWNQRLLWYESTLQRAASLSRVIAVGRAVTLTSPVRIN